MPAVRGLGWSSSLLNSVVHLDVEDFSEEMLRQHYYAIKNQQGASKKPLVGGFGCDELVLYGIRDTGVATATALDQ